MPRRKKPTKTKVEPMCARFESSDGGLVGMGASWLVNKIPIVVMTPDLQGLEMVAGMLGKEFLEEYCISVLYKEKDGKPKPDTQVSIGTNTGTKYVDTGDTAETVRYGGAYRTRKDVYTLFTDMYVDIFKVYSQKPYGAHPAVIFQYTGDVRTPVFRWSTKKLLWVRMNPHIYIHNDPDEIPF